MEDNSAEHRKGYKKGGSCGERWESGGGPSKGTGKGKNGSTCGFVEPLWAMVGEQWEKRVDDDIGLEFVKSRYELWGMCLS